MTQDDLANVIIGTTANNILNGGAGADTLRSLAGDDTYFVDNTGDIVTDPISSGIDTVNSNVTFAIGSSVENLTLTSTDNNLANNIIGKDNMLSGLGGNDILDGGSGNDTLIGGAGGDNLTGGTGIDTFAHTVVGDSAGANIDTINDFLVGGDKIDLSAIDVNTGIAGNQTFTFIDATAFSVRVEDSCAMTVLLACWKPI